MVQSIVFPNTGLAQWVCLQGHRASIRIFCQQTEVRLCGEGGSLQTQLFSQAKPHNALQPANFGVQLNSQRVAYPEIVPFSSSQSPLHWESGLQDGYSCLLQVLLAALEFVM